MSWMLDLYNTYQNNLEQVGKLITRGKRTFTLLPVGHAYANAQIEVTVTPDGEFYRATVIPKDDAPTIMPVTEASENRAGSKLASHLLHDGLKYVAGDFGSYVDEKENKKDSDGQTANDVYLAQLKDWSESPHSHPDVQSIYAYLSKKTLIKDLVEAGVLHTQNDLLLPKWDKNMPGERPEIFSVIPGEQYKATVRFKVHDPNSDEIELAPWENPEFMGCVVAYLASTMTEKSLDYLTGKMGATVSSHPSGLRRGGDMAKLISANDKKNFTYLGRFTDKSQALSLTFDVSRKAHNALRWLIAKQGMVRDDRTYLTWSDDKVDVLQPDKGADELFFAIDPDIEAQEIKDLTNSEFAKKFNLALLGYGKKLDTKAHIHVMILDSATPGRLGVLYYNSFNPEDYFKRLTSWHEKSGWQHDYNFKDGQRFSFYGAPSVYDIAHAALDEHASDKVINQYTETLLTCIVDNRRIPRYIYQNLVERASNPNHFENNSQWQKTVSIACSMVKNYFEEDIKVSIDENYKDRSYLFGRLLAVADVAERRTFDKGEERATNAQRYLTAFSMHPKRTWKIIRENLNPYLIKLGNKGSYYQKLFEDITDSFSPETFSDKPLSGDYILGYDSQHKSFYPTHKEEK